MVEAQVACRTTHSTHAFGTMATAGRCTTVLVSANGLNASHDLLQVTCQLGLFSVYGSIHIPLRGLEGCNLFLCVCVRSVGVGVGTAKGTCTHGFTSVRSIMRCKARTYSGPEPMAATWRRSLTQPCRICVNRCASALLSPSRFSSCAWASAPMRSNSCVFVDVVQRD